MTRTRSILISAILILIAVVSQSTAGIILSPEPNIRKEPVRKTPPNASQLDTTTPQPTAILPDSLLITTEPDTITLLAVGDILFHDTCIRSGFDPKTNTYDFSAIFSEVAPLFHKADLVIGNMEGKLADTEIKVNIWEYKDFGGYTGYPLFNAPPQLATDLKEAGFTAVTTANNHAMDRLSAGIFSTNRHLDEAGLIHAGTSTSQADRDSIRILEADGFRIAFLSCTYGTNGILPDSSQPWLVNYIDLKQIRADVERAKALHPDLILITPHWGIEYQRTPNDVQTSLADSMFAMGIDIILGSHPHVVQPCEIRYSETDSTRIKGVVIYSLGNFISNQSNEFTDEGLILQVDIARDTTGVVFIADVVTHPTWVQRWDVDSIRYFKVIPIEEKILVDKDHPPALDRAMLEKLFDRAQKHLQSLDTDEQP